jgi:hypothetical protein
MAWRNRGVIIRETLKKGNYLAAGWAGRLKCKITKAISVANLPRTDGSGPGLIRR